MEDKLWWKMTFDGRQPLIEDKDNLLWKCVGLFKNVEHLDQAEQNPQLKLKLKLVTLKQGLFIYHYCKWFHMTKVKLDQSEA